LEDGDRHGAAIFGSPPGAIERRDVNLVRRRARRAPHGNSTGIRPVGEFSITREPVIALVEASGRQETGKTITAHPIDA